MILATWAICGASDLPEKMCVVGRCRAALSFSESDTDVSTREAIVSAKTEFDSSRVRLESSASSACRRSKRRAPPELSICGRCPPSKIFALPAAEYAS
eukprot:4689175-Prymnesium_polylepis.1